MYKNGDATRIGLGIAAMEEYNGFTTILESISNLSLDIEPVEHLVDLCNNLQFNPIYLQDVVNNFLATV